MEVTLHTDPLHIDSDHDGFTDGSERALGEPTHRPDRKLRRPEPARPGRARLEGPLLDGGSLLGLVVAPPGSGKTKLPARVAAASPVPVAFP